MFTSVALVSFPPIMKLAQREKQFEARTGMFLLVFENWVCVHHKNRAMGSQ